MSGPWPCSACRAYSTKTTFSAASLLPAGGNRARGASNYRCSQEGDTLPFRWASCLQEKVLPSHPAVPQSQVHPWGTSGLESQRACLTRTTWLHVTHLEKQISEEKQKRKMSENAPKGFIEGSISPLFSPYRLLSLLNSRERSLLTCCFFATGQLTKPWWTSLLWSYKRSVKH